MVIESIGKAGFDKLVNKIVRLVRYKARSYQDIIAACKEVESVYVKRALNRAIYRGRIYAFGSSFDSLVFTANP